MIEAGFTDVAVPFVLLLGILIFIHELGHFVVAKYFDVKCERFSMGFGPTLFSRTVGETEYVLAALPLGGYVKMLGEIPGEELPDEDRDRAFNHKPVYQRIAISLAGPAMNLVLPVFLIAAMLMAGMPTLTSKVAAVAPGTAAEVAGLLAGDRVVGIEGQEVWRWADLTRALRESRATNVELEVEREAERLTLLVQRERLPESKKLAPIGIEPSAPAAIFGVPDVASAAGQAGLRTGDRINAINGKPIADRYAAERALASSKGRVEIEAIRVLGDDEETRRVTIASDEAISADALGLIPIDFAVNFVDPASPAKRAGVEIGDIFMRADGVTITSWDQLVEAIRGSGGRSVELTVLRKGEQVDLAIQPIERAVQVGEETETHYAIGIGGGMLREGGEMREDVVRNPLVAVWRGTQRTAEIFGMILGGIAQLVTGKVGLNTLAGPIGIGEIAADTFSVSWLQFFSFMAVISVNLAILNLLPIPILDGGQIVLAAAEGIKGSPLPIRAREIAQTVGLSLILLLMGFAFWNDLARNWAGIVGFFKGLV